jgi:hypothetical protein
MRLTDVREQLRLPLPPATLLLGPDPEILASEAAQHNGGLTFGHFSVTAEGVRGVRKAAALGSSTKIFTLAMDGASDQAQNALLKLLEEPPEQVRFILMATEVPLPTIVSRCRVLMWTEADEATDREAADKAIAVLRAALNHDESALARLFHDWGEEEHEALITWAVECASGWYRRFDRGEVALPRGAAILLLRLMVSESRRWVGDRSALERVVARYA